MITPILQLN